MLSGHLYKKLLSLGLFLTVAITTVNAAPPDESYVQTLSGKIIKGASCTVIDDKFLNLPMDQWNLVRNLSVNNFITFELRQDTNIYYYNKPFTCTLNFSVQYFSSRDQVNPTEIKNLSLVVKYDTTTGKSYPVFDRYSFKNAYKVIITVDSVFSPEWGDKLPAVFRIRNQILVQRKYPFTPVVNAKLGLALAASEQSGSASRINPGAPSNNSLTVSWDLLDFSGGPGGFGAPEEYDLEWTYIDKLSDRALAFTNNTITDLQVNDLMRYDNSRVTITSNSYKINLAYTEGYIVTRVRGAWMDDVTGLRKTTNWQYLNASGQVAFVEIACHESNLNWQYNVSYAEEGKRKEVISYFDGSLRSRQSVTLSNSEQTLKAGSTTERQETAIVQESIYDNMGRPTLSILPAPVRSSILKFYPAFNQNAAGAAYSHADIHEASGSICTISADGLNTVSGTANYYSPANSFISDPQYYFTKYVPSSVAPDGTGYPFALTEYMPDNTGRVRRQGGVGHDFRTDGDHQTTYFYSKPLQSELYRMFGMEVGINSHYLKNMVVDPNGQASVTYIDANGKTIATALAGIAPGNMDELPSATAPDARKTMTQVLMNPTDFQVNPSTLSKEATTVFLAEVKNTSFTVNYSIAPASLINSTTSQPWNGPVIGQQFCSNCYYQIDISIKDNCGTLVSTPVSTSAFQINNTTCSPNAQPVTGSINFIADKLGEYTVNYRLHLSEDVINYQTDYYIDHNLDLFTLQHFFEQELLQTDILGCYSDCESCTKLEHDGFTAFSTKVKALMETIKNEKYPGPQYSGFSLNTDAINGWISAQYNNIMSNCNGTILPHCVASPCEEKLEMMKADVRPGGQYLLFTPGTYEIPGTETGVSILYVKNGAALNYKNDAQITNFSFVDENGHTRHIKDAAVTDAMFIKAYQQHPEWADDFVKRHIEYCSYLWCINSNNETSYAFDEKLREIVTKGSDAVAAGYYSQSDPYALLNNTEEVFFKTGGAGNPYYSQMYNDLTNLSDVLKIKMKDVNGNDLPGKNILQLIDWMLYCKPEDPNATISDFANSWTSCTPDAGCRSLSSEWELYRNYYLMIKSKYIRLAKLAHDPGCDNCFIGQDPISATICVDPGPLSDYTIFGGIVNQKIHYKNGTAPFKGDYRIKLQYTNGDYYYVNVSKGAMTVDVSSLGQPGDPIWTIVEIKCQSGHSQASCDDQTGPPVDEFICPGGDGNIQAYIDDGFDNPCYFGAGATLYVNYIGPGLPIPSYIQVTIPVQVLPWQGSGPHTFNIIIDNITGSGQVCIDHSAVGPDVAAFDPICEQIAPPPPPPPPPAAPSSSCKDNPLYPLYASKIRIFNDFVDMDGYTNCLLNNAPTNPTDVAAQEAASIDAMRDQANDNLLALKQNWIDHLKAVRDEENQNDDDNNVTRRFGSITDAMITTLTDNLYLVAKKYIDIAPKENIRAASTLPPGQNASNGYNNFTDVFTAIIGTTLMHQGFGPNLLEQPYPYDKTPVLISPNVSELNSGICTQVTLMKSRWVAAGSPGIFHDYLKTELGDDFVLSVDELNDLETRCANNCRYLDEPLLLPAVFAPAVPTNNNYSPWVTCTGINSLYSSFQTSYPNVTSGTKLYRNLLTNYLNASLGFALAYDDYDDFKNTACVASSNAVLYAKPGSPLIQVDNVLACEDNILRNVFTNAGLEYQTYIETERRKFRNAYISKCLASGASATLTGEQYEYHYTLYYYDQSGNLVKTIPPEGVKLLTDEELELVEDFHDDDPAVCTGTGIPNSENATATFNALSSGLQGASTHGTEMWLYSSSTGTTRQIRIVTPDHKYFYQVAIYQGKLWAEMYSLQESGAANDEISITLSNEAVADISSLPSLQQWTHLQIQSTGSLTSGTLQLYLDGRKLTNMTGTLPPYPFEWEINSSTGTYTLPTQDIAVLKHFRIYDRTATDAEVWADYKNSCLAPVGALAVQSSPLQYWGRFNIPAPGGVTTTGPGSTTEYINRFIVPDHGLPTNYAYNSLNQVIKQSSPDAGTSEFFYDRLSRLIISQNQEQKTPAIVDVNNPANRYSYTKYDPLSRITVVGEKVNPTSIVTEDLVRSFPVDGHPDENDPYYTSHPNVLLDWFNSGNNRQVTMTFYDLQPSWVPTSLVGLQKNLRKRVVASVILSTAVNNPDPSQNREAALYYSYDLIGNVNTLVQENRVLATIETGSNGLKTIKYEYDLVSGKVNKVLYQDGKWDQFYYQYIYDADNRIIKSLSSRNNIGDPSDDQLWIREATYRYYLHGPLARMELGRNKVQGIDYAYTLRGWLKGVNSQSLDPARDMSGDGLSTSVFSDHARDAYGFSLGYYDGDYTAIGGTTANAFNLNYTRPSRDPDNRTDETGKELFNGNISYATYAIKEIESGSTAAYTYRYDQLNRLTGMRRNTVAGGATGWSNTGIIEAYKEEVSYDANGNIKTYLRNGNQTQTPLGAQMDKLTYQYERNSTGKLISNKLRYVLDEVEGNSYTGDIKNQTNLSPVDVSNDNAASQVTDNYQYDHIGNLISDIKEGVQQINWTVYGKIASIAKGNTTINYAYDPGGNRISKTVTVIVNGVATSTTTYYVRDAQGTVLGVYESGGGSYTWKEQHLYGASRLGMLLPGITYPGSQAYPYTNANEDPVDNGVTGKRRYELTNHLGNVMVTISDRLLFESEGGLTYPVAEILSATDYYPFGMVQPGRNYSAGGNYRYGFQKQETDYELWNGASMFKYRIADTRLGRFFSTDPLEIKFPWNSPYSFSQNIVINGVEFEGLEVYSVSEGFDFMFLLVGGEANAGFAFGPDGVAGYYTLGARAGIGVEASVSIVITTFPAMPSVKNFLGASESASISGGFLGKFGWGAVTCSGYEGIQWSVGVGGGFQASYEWSWATKTSYFSWTDLSNLILKRNDYKDILKKVGIDPNISQADLSKKLFEKANTKMIEFIDKDITAKRKEIVNLTSQIGYIKKWLEDHGHTVEKPKTERRGFRTQLADLMRDSLKKYQEKIDKLNQIIKKAEETKEKIKKDQQPKP
jgi:hypothetical protein